MVVIPHLLPNQEEAQSTSNILIGKVGIFPSDFCHSCVSPPLTVYHCPLSFQLNQVQENRKRKPHSFFQEENFENRLVHQIADC